MLRMVSRALAHYGHVKGRRTNSVLKGIIALALAQDVECVLLGKQRTGE